MSLSIFFSRYMRCFCIPTDNIGRCKFRAKVTLVVPPWMVMATHGWWFPEKPGEEPSLFGVWESKVNQLIPMGFHGKDGLGAPIKRLLCNVYKVNRREERENGQEI